MAKIEQPRELLATELQSMLYVERELAETVLPELRDEITNNELKTGISKHLEQTRRHVQNVERALELLNEEPQTEKSPAFDGLTKQHDSIVKKIDDQHLEDIVHAGAAAKTEHLEIASYKAMIELAEQLGESEIVPLLEENLDQEKLALQEAEQASQKLSREHVHA
jgi:ferritin-like metal-binding protein YciE